MLEEAAVIYLDFNRAFDAVSESLVYKSDEDRLYVKVNDRENCFRWRKVFKFLQTLLSDSNLINQIKLISYSSLAADSDKTFQLQAITSSVA